MPQLRTAVIVLFGVFAITRAAEYFVRVKEIGNVKVVPIFPKNDSRRAFDPAIGLLQNKESKNSADLFLSGEAPTAKWSRRRTDCA